MSSPIPPHVQVLVIGAGPAGSYAAAALAREGIDVAIFEAAKFPRYHVGESLIPSVRHYFRFIGAEHKLANHGFVRKPGSAIKFNQFKREGYTDFIALGHNNNAWNVVRSEFDKILMDHACVSGASVYELTRVTSIQFSQKDPTNPISATWSHTPYPHAQPITGTTTFDYIIDASGRAGIISTAYLKNRHFNASLKNIAAWGYWKNVNSYGVGTSREGAPWFEALTDESGWAWFIPLHNGTTSVGIVMSQKVHRKKSQQPSPPSSFSFTSPASRTRSGSTSSTSSMTDRYLSSISLAPGVLKLIGSGVLVSETLSDGAAQPSVRSASDFSYSAPEYAGNGYRIVGDAGAFIDPFFSSGIHLALTSALSAAASICASIRGDCSEAEAAEWHTKRVSVSYTRFQVVVLSAYKQIRAQRVNVLSDINEDNYDRAFSFLRPVIQGASDMGTRLSETELQKSLDFCVNLFNPTSPEQHARVARSAGAMMDVTKPVVDPEVLAGFLRMREGLGGGKGGGGGVGAGKGIFCGGMLGGGVGVKMNVVIAHTGLAGYVARGRSCSESSTSSEGSSGCGSGSDSEKAAETKMVLEKINARRVVHSEYGINNLESEPVDGMVVRLEKGRLGLVRAGAGGLGVQAQVD